MAVFRYFASGNAPDRWPTELFFGLLWFSEDDAVELPLRYPFRGEWGKPESTHLLERETFPAPRVLDIVWLSLVEREFYSLYELLPTEQLEKLLSETNEVTGEPICSHLVVGMAPYGGIALWAYGPMKSTLVLWSHAEKEQVSMAEFLPANPDISLEVFCSASLEGLPAVLENLEENGIPPAEWFDQRMEQYSRRYRILFGKWDEEEEEWEEYEEGEVVPELDSVKETCFDGTYDLLNDGRLLDCHRAGKPEKLALTWHVRKWLYEAYFWFSEEGIRAGFDRVCGEEPDKDTDLIVRIDPSQVKVEVSLNREGMEEPFVIPEEAYELILFRNRLESFRSENYSQEKGAWLW